MTFHKRSALFVAALVGTAGAAQAAISFTGLDYVQDFDSKAGATNSAASVVFANDNGSVSGGLEGLYAYLSGGTGVNDAVPGVPDRFSRNSGTGSPSTATTTYTVDTTYAHYWYRPAGNPDISLGFFNADTNSRGVGVGYISAGFAFVNNTGEKIDHFTLHYTPGRSSSANPTNVDGLSVSWAIDATGVSDADGAWTDVPGMGFSVTPAPDLVLTGPSVDTATGIDWDPGEVLFVRFRDGNVGGTDRLMWVNNLVFSVPEPASLMVLGGAATMLLRRRRGVGR